MFDEPIKTIEQAKEFFRAFGCSHFHMYREYPVRMYEYEQLGISKQTEREWRQERFDERYADILLNTDAHSLWSVHSQMYDLFEGLSTESSLRKMLQVTQDIRDRVPPVDRVIVAETINGRGIRQIRSGLIYVAYDLGHIPIAKAFVELSLHFSIYYWRENRGEERCRDAALLCKDIARELGL